MPSITWSACPTHPRATEGGLANRGAGRDAVRSGIIKRRTLFRRSGMCLRIAASCSGAMPASTLPGRLGCVAPGAAGWLPDDGWLAAGAEGTYWRAGSWAGCVDAISFGMVIGYRTVSSRSRACADCVEPPGISAHKSFQTSYIAIVVSDSEEDPLLVGGRGGLEGTILNSSHYTLQRV